MSSSPTHNFITILLIFVDVHVSVFSFYLFFFLFFFGNFRRILVFILFFENVIIFSGETCEYLTIFFLVGLVALISENKK